MRAADTRSAGSPQARAQGETFEVVPRQELGPEAWDAVADGSDDAWLWHVFDLADALETWEGAADLGFALRSDDGRVAAIMPLTAYAFARARGRLRVARVQSLGGPAVAPWLVGKARDRARAAAIEEAIGRAARCGGVSLEVALPALAPALRGERCPRVNPLCELGLENTLTQTWVVDLRPGRDAVWNGMKTRARGEIHKAERAGVTVRLAAETDDLDRYYALHVGNYERTGATPHPFAYFASIWRALIATGRATAFAAELDGETIAARTFGTYKRAGIYWTGAASERGLGVGAGALVQWHAMSWLIENGYEWSETGEAFPGSTDPKSRGLTLHKASFGGELYPYFKGRREISRRGYEAVLALHRLRGALTGRAIGLTGE